MSRIDQIIKLFHDRGDSEYGGEAVTQREHALQTALLAEQHNAAPSLIAAALLHDIGHLLHGMPDDAPDSGVDDCHEALGEQFLKQIFPPKVTEPVRLHVPAKRYLCATDSKYLEQLSQPSIVSLKLQGGPMSVEEAEQFESLPSSGDAVQLRRWDDEAKVVGQSTPSIEHFVAYLTASAKGNS